jgi:elongation factor P--(R)-beta-lysine ligase
MSAASDNSAGDETHVRADRAGLDWRPSCDLETLRERARVLADVRAYFAESGVLEVDTPVLACATVTDPHIDSLYVEACSLGAKRRWYLQTSPEFHMKRLLAAGAPSIVRIGPVFRQDEHGRLHSPEFTMIEWYRRDYDLPHLIDDVRKLVDRVLGPAKFRTVSFRELLLAEHGLDPFAATRSSLESAAAALPAAPAPGTLGARELLDLLFASALEALGAGRTFVTGFPSDQAALARCRRDHDGHEVAERFELIVDGIEIANGYHELQDAHELARRMRRDQAERAGAGALVPESDERLLAAMHHGLPACAGVALGFDRLLMCRMGKRQLAEVMPFSIDRS